MIEMLSMDFMRNALMAGFLVAVTCGIIGSFVVVNRLASLSGGIAHASYGGIGLSVFFGFSPMIGAFGFSVLCALLMGWLTWKDRSRADTLNGVIWAFGMALGIILTDLTPGYTGDMMSFLFGSILTVPMSLVQIMCVLTLVIVGLTAFFFAEFHAISYDAEFARIRGVRVLPLYLLMIVLIALTVVMATQAVGLILVIALLTIPAYIAESRAGSLKKMIVLSSLISCVLTFGGLLAATVLNLTVGPVIIIFGVSFYLLNLLLKRVGL